MYKVENHQFIFFIQGDKKIGNQIMFKKKKSKKQIHKQNCHHRKKKSFLYRIRNKIQKKIHDREVNVHKEKLIRYDVLFEVLNSQDWRKLKKFEGAKI